MNAGHASRGHASGPSPFRRRQPPRYRAEWRRLVADPCSPALSDIHFETAVRPAALRRFVLSVAPFALGGEFRIEAPDRQSVYTDRAAVAAWDARVGTLPAAAADSLWLAERRLAGDVEDMVAEVRAAVLRGAARGAIGMSDALFVADMARSVARRFPV